MLYATSAQIDFFFGNGIMNGLIFILSVLAKSWLVLILLIGLKQLFSGSDLLEEYD